MHWKTNDRIIFIGDSITEKGRLEDPGQLGDGYVRLIHDFLITQHPSLHLEVLNKGIGGNRITDLVSRWDEDVVQNQPDWLSISIGINDVWRQFDRPEIEQVSPEYFEKMYDNLLIQSAAETKAQFILMEPTIIEEDPSSQANQLLRPYVEAVRRLAEKHNAVLIPTHQAFLEFLQAETNIPLTTDGVHMNTKGDMLMASTWIQPFYSN